MNLLRSLRCQVRGFWETVTMPDFWLSLLQPPLVTVSGHVWPTESLWTQPVMDPEHGPIEYDASACVQCGHIDSPLPWRLYHGPLSSTPPTRPGWPFTDEMLSQVRVDGVIRSLVPRAGSADTAQPALTITLAGFTRLRGLHYEPGPGAVVLCWCGQDHGPSVSAWSIGANAGVELGSSTSTPTPSRALPRSHEVS